MKVPASGQNDASATLLQFLDSKGVGIAQIATIKQRAVQITGGRCNSIKACHFLNSSIVGAVSPGGTSCGAVRSCRRKTKLRRQQVFFVSQISTGAYLPVLILASQLSNSSSPTAVADLSSALTTMLCTKECVFGLAGSSPTTATS
jgi:hypothetical protein